MSLSKKELENIRRKANDKPKRRMTYKQKWEEVMDYLADHQGWTVSRHDRSMRLLKTPYATTPNGLVRAYFKPQSIYVSVGPSHKLQGSHSIDPLDNYDFRKMDPESIWAIIYENATMEKMRHV